MFAQVCREVFLLSRIREEWLRTLLVPATMRLLGRWNWWLPGLPLPPKQTS